MAEYTWDFHVDTSRFEVMVDRKNNYGYFEHHIFGDTCGGGLWFVDNELVDYDGTAYLPAEVCEALREGGFTVGSEFE